MGERAERLWVGEPGRLSPDDRERFKEERLRLVWSRLDCLVIFLNRELRFFLKRQSQREHVKTQQSEVGMCSDALLSLLGSRPLAAARHLGFIAGLAGRTNFYRGVLEGSRRNRHLVPALQKIGFDKRVSRITSR